MIVHNLTMRHFLVSNVIFTNLTRLHAARRQHKNEKDWKGVHLLNQFFGKWEIKIWDRIRRVTVYLFLTLHKVFHPNLVIIILISFSFDFYKIIVHGYRLRTSVNARIFSGVYTKWYAGRLDVILPEKLCYNMIIFFQTFMCFSESASSVTNYSCDVLDVLCYGLNMEYRGGVHIHKIYS